ncbi:hypothetical protein CVT26_008166 [Gymnopilus dilepis]|uniref:Aromatic-L-amino-acid decarboxylase n=1 Tax=Gymnopilus dilepis TaxID=231916 RepID=A0A409XX73_9AGAR|nr:hypothetical protein CVT26_008166 [Gymnopilus dilepis]
MDIEQFRKAGYQAIDRICDYYYSLQNRDVVPRVEPGYLREHIPLQPPEEGEDFQVIADDYHKFILPGLTHWQHPSFFAYFPTASTFEGMLGDLYASSIPNPGFNWLSSPACTELENIVMDWSADLLGLSSAFHNASGIGGGVLQTTASDSALVAVVAARSKYQRAHPTAKMEDLVIYTTSQTHSLGAKAGLILGLQVRSLDVKLEDELALRGEVLRTALEEDVGRGRRPFILIVTVGTTSTGAVDNMPEIREVAKDYPDLWIHVDAAWAGMALSCPETRDKLYLEEINAFADSFCTNFHKWGLVNFDCSTLWVRERRNLTEALDITPVFLRTKQGDAGTVIDYRNWHLALGRRFRSLKLWFVLRSYGVQGFQKYIRRCIDLNQHFVKLIQSSSDLALATSPSLALSVFRVVPKPRSPSPSQPPSPPSFDSLNDLNRIFYGRLSARHDIMLTQTSLNGMFCVRLAVGAAATTEEHIEGAFRIVESEANAAIETWDQTVNGVALVGFRKAGYQAIDRICEYAYSLQQRDVVPRVEPGYLRQHIPQSPPEEGEDFQVIADDYQKYIIPGLTNWQHPSFFAYFPTPATFEGVLGDLYSSAISNPGFNWSSSPACTELENIVMDWSADLLGLSSSFHNASGVGGGVIQTTASDSALVSIVAARSKYLREHPEARMEDLVIYTTTQTHSLGAKAGLVLGLQVRSIEVKAEDHFALRGDTFRQVLEEDARLGRRPFALIATVGTTSTGAVDNLPEIFDVVKQHPYIWVHVDAAWAGIALACPENRQQLYLDEINSFADSFCTNFHKWGLVNLDCSALWVKDRRKLTDALDITPIFLRTKQSDAGSVIDYRNWHLGLSRRFRSLKLWFVLRGFGVQGFRKHVRRSIELNQLFVRLVEGSQNLVLATPPSLALTVFRVVPKSRLPSQRPPAAESLNELNRIFYARLSARHDIMLTQTSLNGMICVRLAVGATRTAEEHIYNAFNIVEKEAEIAIETWRQSESPPMIMAQL